MSIHQYAIYRRKEPEGGSREDYGVHIEDYRAVYTHTCEEKDSALSIRKALEREPLDQPAALLAGDVLVLNHDGVVISYYVEQDRLRIVPEFIQIPPKENFVHPETKDYRIAGMGEEKWSVCDTIIIDGEQFFLMESNRFRKAAAMPILDAYGKVMIRQSFHGFSPDVIDQIRRKRREMAGSELRIQSSTRQGEKSSSSETGNLLLRYAKYQKTLLRGTSPSKEKKVSRSGQKKPEQQSLKTGSKRVGKKNLAQRESVLLRLRQKQAEIAKKYHSAASI